MASKPKMFGSRSVSTRNDNRVVASKRGYDRKWRQLRQSYIAEHPLCQHCEKRGMTTPATEVDHIIEFGGIDDPLRLDPDNLQSLCRRCHAIKTHRDKRR